MIQTELLVGDPAPRIQVQTFLKGEPIMGFAPGTVHVVEFWATWCGPCKASIPHLTELQGRYPDVPVLGVAVTWKDFDALAAFVREQGDAIGYRIAADASPQGGAHRGRMHADWCDAAYQAGVPTAFIVDRAGRVAWIGHPIEIDAPLAEVVEGTWDLDARAEEHRAWLRRDKVRESQALKRAVAAHLEARDRPGALGAYDEAFAADPDLERTHGFGKLKLLLSGDADAGTAPVDYARRLIGTVASEDVNTLFKIGTVLTEQAGEPAGEADRTVPAHAAAPLAVAALERAEDVLGEGMNAAVRVRLSRALAEALVAAGRTADAAARVRAARDGAVAAEMPEATLAELDLLLARCEAAGAPRPEGAVICEGDSCRLAGF